MNNIVVAVFTALIASINAKINTTNIPETSYLFSFFDSDEKAGLRVAYSTDGYTFEALADNKVLLKPQIGDKILRDPCILYGPDGVFHLVWTTSWHNDKIGYASSKDLITWSPEIAIPVMSNFPHTQNTWAPEVIYDYDKKHYLIFWSSIVLGTEIHDPKNYDRIYSSTTTDFKTFTPSKIHFDAHNLTIDATLLHDVDNKNWLMFVKYTDIGIRMVKGPTLEGPWGPLSAVIVPQPDHKHWAEGPTAIKIGKYYHLYHDKYIINQMGLTRSTDLINWEDVTSKVKFPPKAKHGTIIKVTPDIVKMLANKGL